MQALFNFCKIRSTSFMCFRFIVLVRNKKLKGLYSSYYYLDSFKKRIFAANL
jgi:hypothetical protein